MSTDLYSDAGHAMLRTLLTRCPGAVPLVKTAKLEDSRDEIPHTAFAWAGPRLYPVHTPEHAAISYLYAKHASAVPVSVLEGIEEALEAYGIDKKALAEVQVKVAAPVADECVFPDRMEYPVRNAAEAKVAQDALLAQIDKMLPSTRFRVFNKLAALADKHGVELEMCAKQWAGETETDRTKLAQALDYRMTVSGVTETRKAYAKLAEAIQTDRRAMLDPRKRAKLAMTIDAIDKMAKLAMPVPDAFRTVYNTEVKTGAASCELGGSRVDPSHFARLPASFYSDALGKDVLAECAPGGVVDGAKVAEIVGTLPTDMKQDFARQLKAAGIPVL